MEKISVIIPCYNDGAYLSETIEKLLQQTVPIHEIIIVNDGSTDVKTLQVLNNIESDPKIKVIHQENKRMSAARNTGVNAATGEYIVALDADDYFDNRFFEKALSVFNKEPNVAVVTSYIKYFGERTGNAKPRGGAIYNFLFSNQCPACAMVRKTDWDQVGGYDENMRLGYEDWEFYIRITKEGKTVFVIDEYLLYYRQTKKSTLQNDTHPNRKAIIQYIINKHQEVYSSNLIDLIDQKEVLYTESRISFQNIWKMLKNRLTKKYK